MDLTLDETVPEGRLRLVYNDRRLWLVNNDTREGRRDYTKEGRMDCTKDGRTE
jgi:hypothetical protein